MRVRAIIFVKGSVTGANNITEANTFREGENFIIATASFRSYEKSPLGEFYDVGGDVFKGENLFRDTGSRRQWPVVAGAGRNLPR
jgi:hypothetical protein